MSDAPDAAKLLPCPFCEGPAEMQGIKHLRYAMCFACGAKGSMRESEVAAITAWNTRPQPAASTGLAMTEAKPLTAEEIADELRDLCACGHERELHKKRGCKLCGLQCRQFRFSALNEIRRFYAARQKEQHRE